MISRHSWRIFTLAALGPLLCALSAPAMAQTNDSSGFYGGLSLGSSRGNFDEARIAGSVAGAGTTVTSVSRDSRSTAYRLLGGYQFNRYLALEASYFDLGHFGFSGTTAPAGTLNGRIRVAGVGMDVVGSLPVGDSFALLARAGGQWARTRDTFSTSGAATLSNASPSHRGNNPKVGLGAQFDFSPSLLLRGEAERYRINDAVGQRGDVNVLSVSLVMRFGGSGSAARRSALPPAASLVAGTQTPPQPEPNVFNAAPPAPPAPLGFGMVGSR